MNFSILHVSDSFALLKGAPSGIFDHVITDPPYDAHTQANQVSGTAMKRWVNGEIESSGIPKKTLKFDPLESYAFAADCIRIAKRWSLVFCAVEGFGEFRRVAGSSYVRGGIWYKPNAQGQMTGDRPAACYEGIAIMHAPTKKIWNGRGSYGLWPCNSTRGKKGRHDNEKPIDLCLKLVSLFTDRGDTVFDPFCGSAAIGEACLLLGRKYYGWDSDPLWVSNAIQRLSLTPFGSVEESDALKLCTARKVDILETAL